MLDIFWEICTTPPSKIKWSTPNDAYLAVFGRKFMTDLYLTDSFDCFDGIRSIRAMVRSFQTSLFHVIVTLFHNIVRTFHESLSHKQKKWCYSCVYCIL